jgi:hypothetical protein
MINTKFYQRGNAAYTAYGDGFRLWIVAAFAWLMRVQVKVEGLPFGGSYKIAGILYFAYPNNLPTESSGSVATITILSHYVTMELFSRPRA